MILSTHAIVGASLASLMPDHPALGFSVGVASHFLLDAIPHWDYKLRSVERSPENPMKVNIRFNRKFAIDIAKILLDGLTGLLLVLLLFGTSGTILLMTAFCGAVGGMTPDALQFAYFKWPREPMFSVQRFHTWMHATKRLDNRVTFGLSLQLLIVLASVALATVRI